MHGFTTPTFETSKAVQKPLAWEQILLKGWTTKSKDITFADLFDAKLAVSEAGDRSRKPHACEIERALGWRSDISNRIAKMPKEKLEEREQRRKCMLYSALLAAHIEFAVSAAVPQDFAKYKLVSHPIPMK